MPSLTLPDTQMIYRLCFLVLESYAILFALMGAHKLRRKLGLDLYFILVGGLVVYMWWVTRLGIDALNRSDVRIPVASVAYFSTFFSALLLVYISDGVRMARRLIFSVVALEVLFMILEVFTTFILATSLQGQNATQTYMAHWKTTLWGSVALLCDMFILVVCYQFLQNHFPRRMLVLRLFLALSIALSIDSLIAVTASEFGEPTYWRTLLSHTFGKWIMAALVSPPLAWYISRDTKGDIESRKTFDILRKVDLLTRSLHHTKTKYEVLLNHISEAAFVFDVPGFCVEANPRFFAMTGYSAAELGRFHFTALIAPEHRPGVVAGHSVLVEGGEAPHVYPIQYVRKDGQVRFAEMTLTILREENEITGTYAIFRDTTPMIESERMLSQARALTERAELIRLLSLGCYESRPKVDPGASDDPESPCFGLGEALRSLDEGEEDLWTKEPIRNRLEMVVGLYETEAARKGVTLQVEWGDALIRTTARWRRLMQVFFLLCDSGLHWAASGNPDRRMEIRVARVAKPDGRFVNQVGFRDNGPALDEITRSTRYDPFVGGELTHWDPDRPGLSWLYCRHVLTAHQGELRFFRSGGTNEAQCVWPDEDR